MQTVAELVSDLNKNGIQLWVDAGQIRYRAPPEALTPERIGAIRALKSEIILFLQSATVTGAAAKAAEIPTLRPLSSSEGRFVPLTPAQRAFAPYKPNVSPLYAHLSLALHFDKPIDEPALDRSLRQLVARHSALRSQLVQNEAAEAGYSWVVAASGEYELEHLDLRDAEVNWEGNEAYRRIAPLVARPFDLQRGPLVRVVIAEVGPGAWCVILVGHRAALDNWSLGIMARELLALYRASLAGGGVSLPEVLQFHDFAIFHDEWRASEAGQKEARYWRQLLAGVRSPFWLPEDRRTPIPTQYSPAHASGVIAAEQLSALRALGARLGATVFHLALAGFVSVLQRWSGRQSVLTWVSHFGRTNPRLHGVVGCFSENWLLRVDVAANQSFLQTLQLVRERCAQSSSHLELPGRAIEDELRSAAGGELEPAITFNYVTVPRQPGTQLETRQERVGGIVGWIPFHRYFEPASGEALAIHMFEMPEAVHWTLQYAPHLFEEDTITAFSNALAQRLQSIAHDPGTH